MWPLCNPLLKDDQASIAHAWLDAVAQGAEESKKAGAGGTGRAVNEVMTLREDRTIGWDKDDKWEAMMRVDWRLATLDARLDIGLFQRPKPSFHEVDVEG